MNDTAHQAFVDRYMRARLYGYEFGAPCYIPVLRVDEIHARLLVEAAIFGDSNPELHAAIMDAYIVECDRDEALAAERQRRLPVPLRHELACAFRVFTAIAGTDMGHKWAELMVIMAGDLQGPRPEGLFT